MTSHPSRQPTSRLIVASSAAPPSRAPHETTENPQK